VSVEVFEGLGLDGVTSRPWRFESEEALVASSRRTGGLTGRTRHASRVRRRLIGPDEAWLVLQVEYWNLDSDSSPSDRLWRDACSSDLAELEILSRLRPAWAGATP
jgi:hypothetical protein